MRRKSTKIIAIVACALVLIGCISAIFYVQWIKGSVDYVNFDIGKLNDMCTALTVLDQDGNEIHQAMYLNNNRQIPLSALHEYTYMAFVAVEDKRYFEHSGVDFKRIAGALLHNVGSRSFKEGASTISQQLIKNTHLTGAKTLKRKVNEILLAQELEKRFSKQEILQMYLNTIYFGRSAYGIENAANVYFNKSAADLTVAESATLAGMIKAPNTYAPDKNAAKCKTRRDTVLKLMLEQQILDETQYAEAVNSTVEYQPYSGNRTKTYLHQVVAEACKMLNMNEAQLYRSGFVIETYFDPNVQNTLERYATTDATLNTDGSLADLACIVCNNVGEVQGLYVRGDSCFSPRQIGSTAKPLAVYAPALCERLITEASPVLDEPTDFSGYRPANANGYNGWTTVKTAVSKSLNVPAVKTLNSLGVATAEKYLKKWGIEGEQNLSLALGNVTGGMNVHQLANCYATLANGGVSCGVAYIKRISSENGEIYRRKPAATKVFDNTASYIMTDMLKSAVTDGTAKELRNAGVVTAAKTGTVGNAQGNTDALVAGYTTQHTFVFWYSGNMQNKVNGGTAPCKLASRVLAEMYRTNKPSDFEMPQGATQLTVDRDSLYGKQVVALAQNGETFVFDKANCPTEFAQREEYRLCTQFVNGKVFLQLPAAEGNWKIFKKEGLGTREIFDTAVCEGVYFAELWRNGVLVCTTPQIEIGLCSQTTAAMLQLSAQRANCITCGYTAA